MRKPHLVIGALIIVALGATYILVYAKTSITNYPPRNKTIVAFGDSLVQGVGATQGNNFVSVLSKELKTPIINLGVSGNTTAQGLARIDEVISKRPGTVLVLFGGNDFLRKVPKEETFKNLRKIISTLQEEGAMVVLLGIRGGILSDQFEKDFEYLAQETGVIYISDVLDGLFGHSELMSDEVHPNSKGYALISDRIYKQIEKYVK